MDVLDRGKSRGRQLNFVSMFSRSCFIVVTPTMVLAVKQRLRTNASASAAGARPTERAQSAA